MTKEGSRKGAFQGKTGANRRWGPTRPLGPGRPAHPVLGAGLVRFPVYCPFFAFLAHEKKLAQ
jgi:hypothetical protein